MTTLVLDQTTTADPFACPSWCIEDHTGDDPADCFHRSDPTSAELPAGAMSGPETKPRLLMAHLAVHSVDPDQSCISIGDIWDGFDLATPEQVDVYLSNLTDHLFQVRAMRDQLAEIQR